MSELPIQAILYLLGGAQHGARLVFGFLPFHLGDGIGDDASGGLHVQHAVLDDASADGDRHVHLAAEGQVAAGAAVDAALGDFQFVDHFHRAHFRRAGQRTGREGGTQHVEVGQAVLQLAFDVGDDVLDVRIFFDHQAVGDVDATDLGDAPQVIAGQVDQHHVFGDFLGSASSSFASSASRAGVAPRGRVPAIGRSVTFFSPSGAVSLRTKISGEAPTICMSPKL